MFARFLSGQAFLKTACAAPSTGWRASGGNDATGLIIRRGTHSGWRFLMITVCLSILWGTRTGKLGGVAVRLPPGGGASFAGFSFCFHGRPRLAVS